MSTGTLVPRAAESTLRRCGETFPAVALIGPRQSGKSSLARMVFPQHRNLVLESPDVAEAARSDPRGFLERASKDGGVVLDEVQRAPELLSYLLERIDRDPVPGRWILTGSENLLLSERLSQSLAGRVAMLELMPMLHREIAGFDLDRASLAQTLPSAVFTGGYPAIYSRRADPTIWLASYVATYVERDVRRVLAVGDLVTFQRFLSLCAARTGQLLNMLSLASDAGISQPTAKSWISVLEATFILKLLPAWHGNVRKRLVKTPRLHFVDSGLACHLLGIRSPDQFETHPLRGALFESWAVGEVMKAQAAAGERGRLFHWRDRNGSEVDLLVEVGGRLWAFEMKSGSTFQPEWMRGVDRVLRNAPASLQPRGRVVYGGKPGDIASGDAAISWQELGAEALRLFGV